MKIALCFSGQPRFVPEVYPYIQNNILANNTVDIFAHLWFDENLISKPYKYGGDGNWQYQRISHNAIDIFKEIYRPISIKTESSKRFKISTLENSYDITLKRYKLGAINNPLEPNFTERDINNMFSYYYSLNQVCLLKKEHEYANDFKYDVVIKIRTDTILLNKIDFNIQDNTLYYSNCQNQPDGMINDWLDYGSSNVMDAFMGAFPILEYLIEDCKQQTNGAWCCELVHKKMMEKMGIKTHGLNINISLPRF